MTDEYLQKEGIKLTKALPIYLSAQGITLLMTYLDSPLYMETYLLQYNLTVNGWLGAWFVLVIFGLSTGVFLFISKTWKMVLNKRERVKLGGGYLLGAIAGLFTLGLRFLPIMPSEYFYAIGGLVLLLGLVSIVWNKRQSQLEEIFP